MKKALKWLKYPTLLAISVFLFWLVYRNFDYHRLWNSIRHLHYLYIFLGFVILTLANISRALRWNLLIKPLGYQVGLRDSFVAVMIGYLVNLFLPRAGEVSRCMVLNRTQKIPVDKLIGTVVIERLIDFIALLLLLALALMLAFDKLKGFFTGVFGRIFHSRAHAAQSLFTFWKIFFALLAVAFLFWIIRFLYRQFQHHKIVVKARQIIQGFSAGLRTIGKMQSRPLFIFHSFFIWAMYFLMTYIMFKALDVTSLLGLEAALSVLVMSTFGFVIPVQGGAGTYDFAVIQTLLLYGLSHLASETYAFVSHAFQTLLIILWGAICALWLAAYKKTNEPITPSSAEMVQP